MKKNSSFHGVGLSQFDGKVFPAELEFIKQRRAEINANWEAAFGGGGETVCGFPVKPQAQAAETSGCPEKLGKALAGWFVRLFNFAARRGAPRPDAEGGAREKPAQSGDLCGIALSGGGIRSATFNLGVLQVLAREKLLWRADYLSTVSGGGYIGSCLTSLLNNADAAVFGKKFPFAHSPGVEESSIFKYLRLGGSYLSPKGIASAVKIPALLLCGILVNLLLILPYVLLFILAQWALLREPVAAANKIIAANRLDVIQLKMLCADFYAWTPVALGLFFAAIVVYPFVRKSVYADWRGRDALERVYALLLLALSGIVLFESFPAVVLLLKFLRLWLQQKGVPEIVSGWKALIPLFSLPVFAELAGRKSDSPGGKIAIGVLGVLGPALLVIFAGNVFLFNGGPDWLHKLLDAGRLCYSPACLAGAPDSLSAIPLLLILLFVYTLLVDVNHTSLHCFYRDRLSKAYLIKRGDCGAVRHDDSQKLSGLYENARWAPYHLINATLNLQHSKTSRVEARRADYFLFSRFFTGSESTGYCRTEDMEKADSHLNLGTAVAISGAAAAPNMGPSTSKPLALLMTLLDIRLDYWIANPARLDGGRPPVFGVGPVYLLREYLGFLTETSPYVNVSDGGHIENLGVYELLRRRCRYIIACDSEADPKLHFGGLSEVLRQARIDFGIEIDINLQDVHRNCKGISRRPYALGRIKYGKDEEGYLLYIKSSLPANMDEYVWEYWKRNPSFPHETTADQFFDEAQFEAYRALGYHVASTLLKEFPSPAKDAPGAMKAWFDTLEAKLYQPPSRKESKRPLRVEICTEQ